MSEIKGDAAKQAVDHLIGQGLVDPEQCYNIAQVIREKYAALSSLQAKHDRAIKALQDAKERLEWFRDQKGINSAAQIEWAIKALEDK